MLICSEPFNLLRAGQLACARVEMKYGANVFETGAWWWELEERARPEFEWMAKEARFRTMGSRARVVEPVTPAPTFLRLFGIEVRFVPTQEVMSKRVGKEPLGVGRLTLHTDRTDLTADSRLYR